ncbi:hypothetical protein L1887_01699 [Cichorium endivia]|nr:hypothetical protein L1887_01699 [Cichorium endivia]
MNLISTTSSYIHNIFPNLETFNVVYWKHTKCTISIEEGDEELEVFLFSQWQVVNPLYANAIEEEFEMTKLGEAYINLEELKVEDDYELMSRKDFKKLNVLLKYLDSSYAQTSKASKKQKIFNE